ncbi:MAG: winged helix DNA-binding domain-containing protein [Actinomycetota bacterium]
MSKRTPTATAERTLTERELLRALLARQLLLDRVDLPLTTAIERIGELQTQYAPSGYIALWSRLQRFERDDLTRALERTRVVQATVMRQTIHMVTRRDYRPLTEGIRRGRREWWERTARTRTDVRKLPAIAHRVEKLLADGPMKRADIVAKLDLDASQWNGVGMYVDLVRVPPMGTWDRRRADLYGLADQWLGPPDERPTEQQGLELLAKRYLTAFGPATRKDLATWAGLRPTMFTETLEGMRLRRFRSETGEELIDLPRAPLPDPGTPAPVRFLPVWDATLLVHARRTQILPERWRPRIFNVKSPQSVHTFLVDGRVAGTWRHEAGRVLVEPLGALSRLQRRAVDDEAERLGAFMA